MYPIVGVVALPRRAGSHLASIEWEPGPGDCWTLAAGLGGNLTPAVVPGLGARSTPTATTSSVVSPVYSIAVSLILALESASRSSFGPWINDWLSVFIC